MPETRLSADGETLILASASRTRAKLLSSAGIPIETVASDIDEAAVREAVLRDNDGLGPEDLAMILAQAKADDVSSRSPGRLVVGADQTLELDGRLQTKPTTMEEARRMLLEMRGRTHSLHSAVALMRDGELLWNTSDSAYLTMRDYSPAFVGHYTAAVGPSLLTSVGCYQVEGAGVQLFERIEGSWFTILGLPLIPLLEELRQRGVLET